MYVLERVVGDWPEADALLEIELAHGWKVKRLVVEKTTYILINTTLSFHPQLHV